MRSRRVARPVAALAAALLVANVPPPLPYGRWGNPRGTLAVQIAPCSGSVCGTIVWASPVALTDAHDAGIARLNGIQLLQNYRPAGNGEWAGRVYVPDMGHSFSSHIVADGTDRLTISGCLIGRFLCKSQVWHRLD